MKASAQQKMIVNLQSAGNASAGGALLPVKVEPGKTSVGIDINIWLEPSAFPYPNDPF